jgi:D-3-phosphoglycerate dehydrogenase
MPRLLLSGRIHDDGMTVLRARPDLVIEDMDDEDEQAFVERLPTADALLIRTAILPVEAVRRSRRLRVVSRHGVGYDNVPVEELTAKGVPLTVVGDVLSSTVAEHALFMMLALAKQGLAYDRAVRDGDWGRRNSLATVELSGKALLILGFGRIGREVALRARAFGMRVLAHDPMVGAQEMADRGVETVADWRAALAETDVVSLHLPLTAETDGIIGRRELAAMKPTAYLVNTARGGLIDEAALAEALAVGGIAGAGIDAFEAEPPPPDHPLLATDRVVLSPHCASMTRECAARMAVRAAENVLAGLDGRLDRNLVVNPTVLED